jgi:hypothetical protein
MSEISERIVENFQQLSQEDQEALRLLQTDPEVIQFITLLRKVLPPEVIVGLPKLRVPARFR